MSMMAAFETMGVSSRVLSFNVMEIWSIRDGELSCVFIYADESFQGSFHDLKIGYYPRLKNEDCARAYSLCNMVRESFAGLIWRTVEDEEEIGALVENDPKVLHTEFKIPIRTEIAYVIPSSDLILVGFAVEVVKYSTSKYKYLSGVGYAISVAVHDIDGEIRADLESKLNDQDIDLDTTEKFLPRQYSNANLSTVSSIPQEVIVSDGKMVIPESTRGSQHVPNVNTYVNREITDHFSFPMVEIPEIMRFNYNVLLEDLKNLRHITDGSHSNVFTGEYNGTEVIVKMIKESSVSDPVAVFEFDVECATLARMEHPNILRLIGAGQLPRRFLILEKLTGGTLFHVLNRRKNGEVFPMSMFSRPSFTLSGLLHKARDLASALHYMHAGCSPRATVLHRDLKPDNIGFTACGTLKLIDFGLSTCIRKATRSDEAFEMTGYTGSLRYMAPEVALRRPYNEKCDVYSFGIILWQMARDKIPYEGMTRQTLLQNVAIKGERPKLDRSWPVAFCKLLESCWHAIPSLRPSFSEVLTQIDTIQEEISEGASRRGRWSVAKPAANKPTAPAGFGKPQRRPEEAVRSSWF